MYEGASGSRAGLSRGGGGVSGVWPVAGGDSSGIAAPDTETKAAQGVPCREPGGGGGGERKETQAEKNGVRVHPARDPTGHSKDTCSREAPKNTWTRAGLSLLTE